MQRRRRNEWKESETFESNTAKKHLDKAKKLMSIY
jgi:hypothetical protein